MPKGIIVSQDDDCIVYLTEDGKFHTVKTKSKSSVGETISLFASKSLLTFTLVFVFIFLTFGIIIGGTLAFTQTPTTFFSVDINPGIEFTANRYNKVLTVNATNDAAKILIADENFKGLTIEQSIEKLVDLAVKAGFITTEHPSTNLSPESDDINAIMLFCMNENDSAVESIRKSMNDTANNYFNDKGIFCVILNNMSESTNVRQLAEQLGVSLGKAELLKSAYGDDLKKIESNKNISIKNLNKILTKKNKAEFAEYKQKENVYLSKKTEIIQENQSALSNYLGNLQSGEKEQIQEDAEVFKAMHSDYLINNWQSISKNWWKKFRLTLN